MVTALSERCEIAETIRAVPNQPGILEAAAVVGGGTYATTTIAKSLGVPVIRSERSGGKHLHARALAESGEVLWFVHADPVSIEEQS